jgi:O-antigen/teichoic acid export membrane protein
MSLEYERRAGVNLARSSLTTFLARATSAVVGFVGVVIFARELGPAVMGTFFLFQAAGGTFRVVADFGVTTATKKRLSERTGDDAATLATALAVKSVLTGLVVAGILLGADWIEAYVGADLALWLALSVVVQEASVLLLNVLQAELRVAESAVVRATRRVVWIGVGLWLVTRGWGLRGVVAGYVAGFAFVTVVAGVRVGTSVGRPSRERLDSLVAYAKFDGVSGLGSYAYNWLDVAVLGLFVSQASVGVYEFAWQATLPLVFVSRAIGSATFPLVSRWESERERDRIERVISASLRATTFVLVPAVAGSLVLAEEVFRYVFETPSTVGATVLVILTVEKLVQSGSAVLRRSLDAIDRPERSARVAVVTTVVTAVAAVALVSTVGVVGAAVATLVAFSTGTWLYYRAITEHLAVTLPLRTLAWSTVAAAVTGSAVFWLGLVAPVRGVPSLLVHIAFGVLVYLVVAAAIPELRNEALRPGVNALRRPSP